MSKIKIVCNCGNKDVDIMSCRRIKKNEVEITYICPYCGACESEKYFMYE